MTGNNLTSAEPWLETARNDLDGARHLRDGGFHAMACFHCQQATEKALKAYLRACGEFAVIGHGLTGLCRACATHDASFEEAMAACRRLGRFYVAARYPDALGDEAPQDHYTIEDADGALNDAGQIVALVEGKIEALKAANPPAK